MTPEAQIVTEQSVSLGGNGYTPGERRVIQRLLADGLVSPEDLQRAQREQRESGMRIGYCLVSLGIVPENELTRIAGQEHHVPAIDLAQVTLDERIVSLVPVDFANKHLVLPLRRLGRTLTVAMAEPTDLNVIDDLKFITRFDIEPVVAGEYTLRDYIDKYYHVDHTKLGELLSELEEQDIEVVEDLTEEEYSDQALRAQVEDAPVVKLINGILGDAVRRGASDIHVEPYEPGLDPSHAVRREDRPPDPRQGQPDARPRSLRHGRERGAGLPRGDLEPVRNGPRHRPDRLR